MIEATILKEKYKGEDVLMPCIPMISFFQPNENELPNISNKEQLSLIIRILHIKKVNNKRVVLSTRVLYKFSSYNPY